LNKKVFIIAEAGVNHNGDIGIAKRLIEAAADAGADAVKFQTFKAKDLVSKFAPKAEYQKRNTHNNESQLSMLEHLELSKSMHNDLITYCKLKHIQFLSTPFDLNSINLLVRLGIKYFKIPSGEITNLPYLRTIGRLSRPIILSTGMSNLGEIETALNILCSSGAKRDQITLLHCTTEYPAPLQEVNLQAMVTMRNAFKMHVGYSDHTTGISISLAAVALGAEIIEKHFTLNNKMEGPDHKASLEPDELVDLVKGIRAIEKAIGDGIKQCSFSEKITRPIARKSIVAAKSISKGKKFTEINLAIKRPGIGLSPLEWDRVIGRHATRDYSVDEPIEL
jgi:N,N'-diacetyllegionaminate synthase